VAAAVKAIRAEGHPVLLLDSGDTIQGAPEQAIAFASGAGAVDPIVAAMNLVGYDAMAVGNHEFDFGLPRLEASRKQAKFPFLSANTLARGDREIFPPYAVKELGGVRIGIVGLVTTGVPLWTIPDLLGGLRFVSPLGVARSKVAELRGRARCDFVILLTHQGFEKDPKTGQERPGSSGENQGYALATKIEGVDLVLAGHGHVVVHPQRIGKTWVSAPGRWGEVLTRFDVTFEKANGAAWRVADVRGTSLPMKKVAPDPAAVAASAASHEAAMKLLAVKLTNLETPASTRPARAGDTGLLDWVHRVQLAASGAEMSVASVLAIEPLEWAAGPLTIRQVWQFYPYENGLVTVRASGKTVREALERAAGCFDDPGERLRGCDTLEGAEYAIDPSRPYGKRVVFLRRDGKDVADEDVFTVALNSYRAAGGGGFGMWRRAERIREKGNVRNLLIADARGKKELRLEASGNWKIVR
jgi:2',3'-cyclic-nucleotide 2'-phosphodiesterase/3'-nucleotidase